MTDQAQEQADCARKGYLFSLRQAAGSQIIAEKTSLAYDCYRQTFRLTRFQNRQILIDQYLFIIVTACSSERSNCSS